MTFRKISLMFLGAALVFGIGAGSVKAEYPEKPITMILPLGAGGSHDRNARGYGTHPVSRGNGPLDEQRRPACLDLSAATAACR